MSTSNMTDSNIYFAMPPTPSDKWRGSTGTLWNKKQRSPDVLPTTRPVSATPPTADDTDTPRAKRKGGLRKRFVSLTEGIANLITGEKREKGSQSASLKSVSGSPKRLRKSIFYVDHKNSSDLIKSSTEEEINETDRFNSYNDTFNRCMHHHQDQDDLDSDLGAHVRYPLIHPRLTRSVSQGSGREGGGIKPVKAPPSPPPRRYTLWGINSSPKKEELREANSNNIYSHISSNYPASTSKQRSPPSPPARCRHHPLLSSINPASNSAIMSSNSPLQLTPPSSPLLFGSARSWSSQHPSTLNRNINRGFLLNSNYGNGSHFNTDEVLRDESSSALSTHYAYNFNNQGFHHSLLRNLPSSLSSTPSSKINDAAHNIANPNFSKSSINNRSGPKASFYCRESPYPWLRNCSERGTRSTRNSIERGYRSPRSGSRSSDRVSKSPSHDRKSSLFGLGAYRGDWYRRKAAKTRRSTQHCPGIGPEGVVVRRTSVPVGKEGGSLGLTVRGGRCPSDGDKSRPLVVAHVRNAGPVDREGTIKAGDRLVAVDNRSVAAYTMAETQEALRGSPDMVTLTIEYDVSVLTSVRERGGALLVEVERPAATDLGLVLAQGPQDTIIVGSVRTASIAERCGALAVGDTVNRIDGTCLLQLTPVEATQLLRTSRNPMVTLEIVPAPAAAPVIAGYGVSFPHLLNNGNNSSSVISNNIDNSNDATCTSPLLPSCTATCQSSCNASYCTSTCTAASSYTSCSGAPYHTAGGKNMRAIWNGGGDPTDVYNNGHTVSTGRGTGDRHVRTELMTVTLRESAKGGYGLVLRPPSMGTDPETAVPVVATVEDDSSADRCGVVCVGDRISAVNGHTTVGVGAAEVTHTIASSRTTVTLTVEFDVLEVTAATVPASVAVKLAVKEQPLGVGISLAGIPTNFHPPSTTATPPTTNPPSLTASPRGLVITSVTRGSPAHRSGLVSPGDSLTAVNLSTVGEVTQPQEVLSSIQEFAGSTVTLVLRKDDLYGECSSSVEYTVEVSRDGGPLGLTLSGSEDPLTVLYIAALTPGGLAERTGAVHVGDRLLAIDGQSLRGHPLSHAVRLLHAAADSVTLRIARPRLQLQHSIEEWGAAPHGLVPQSVAPASVDSAVESWGDSSGGGELGVVTPTPSVSPALGVGEDGDTGGHDAASEQELTTTTEITTETSTKIRADHNSEDVSDNKTAVNNADNNSNSSIKNNSCDNNSNNNSIRNNGTIRNDDYKISSNSNKINGSDNCKVMTIRLPSTSPPPTPDSGQSEGGEVSKPDWDEMIAALNHISESCRIADGGAEGSIEQFKDAASSGTGQASPGETIDGSDDVDGEEEGVYNVTAAEMTHDVTGSSATAAGSDEPPSPRHVYRVCLTKDPVYEDFGFSVSDGLYEKGVYVNRVRQGGPADRSGRVRPYDRILQVNDTLSHDFDCCLTVPLIASAGDQLNLLLSRSLNEGATPLLLRRTPDAEACQIMASHRAEVPSISSALHGISPSQLVSPQTAVPHANGLQGNGFQGNGPQINAPHVNGAQVRGSSPTGRPYYSRNAISQTSPLVSTFQTPVSSTQNSATRGVSPLQGKAKLHAQRVDFLNTQLYCNDNPFIKDGCDLQKYSYNKHNINGNDNKTSHLSYGIYGNGRPNFYGDGSCSPPMQNNYNSFNGNINPSFNTSGIPLQTFNRKTTATISDIYSRPTSNLQEQLQSLGAVNNRCHLLEWAEQSLTEANQNQPTYVNIRPKEKSSPGPYIKSPTSSQLRPPLTPQMTRSYHRTNSSPSSQDSRNCPEGGKRENQMSISKLHHGEGDVDVHVSVNNSVRGYDSAISRNSNILTTL